MKAYSLICSLLLVFTMIGCSGSPSGNSTVVQGRITVADSLDSSGDYSGISITIVHRDSAGAKADTLFYQVTDQQGNFNGIAEFQRRGRYPALISRNGNRIGQLSVILADNDTLNITGELPDLRNTVSIQSREHRALETYQRLDRNFQRVLTFVQSGALKGDSLEAEIAKWSDLFWEVYEKNKGTMGSELAASESVRLLQGWKNDEMMKKIRLVQNNDDLAGLGATYGKDYLAASRGLDHALKYLDSLQTQTEKSEVKMRISMERIKLLYDSARVDHAKLSLNEFEKQYPNRNAKVWADAMRYDLNYLSPGDSIPSFSFMDNGKMISRDSLLGTPYILEISTLSNSLFQEQFDRTVVIHSLYKTYGLQVVTLPLDNSQITINAFFEERVKPWPVASADSYDREELINRFNVQIIPTRFLIDREGKIVRKYVGREYTDIIKGLQTLTTKEKPAS